MVQHVAAPPVVRERWIPMSWEEFLDKLLFQWFVRANEIGMVFTSTTLMRLSSRRSGRMPDLFVVLKGQRESVLATWIEGPASFALEILSDESGIRDLREKSLEYAAAGNPEHLIVDGRDGKFTFLWHRLVTDGTYRLIEPDANGRFHSETLSGFWLDSTWLQQDPLPNPLRLLPLISPEAWQRFVSEIESAS